MGQVQSRFDTGKELGIIGSDDQRLRDAKVRRERAQRFWRKS